MKKVLFATTALVASAGIAAAEISFKAGAEMGVVGGDRYDTFVDDDDNTTTPDVQVRGDDLSFHSDVWFHVDASSETDNGLTFGVHMEFDETNGGEAVNGGWAGDNESVYIKGAFGTLTLGEIDGAYDKALKEVALAAGSIADDETEHAGFNGNSGLDGSEDNQILRYDYSFDSFGFSISAEQDDDGYESDDIYGIGFTFDLELAGLDLGFGVGYQSNGDFDVAGISIHSAFDNGFEAAINYSDLDGFNGNDSHWGVGIGYTMDALSMGLNYGEYDLEAGGSEDGFGLAVNYDLGGGAVVQFGYGEGESVESYSLGIAMSF